MNGKKISYLLLPSILFYILFVVVKTNAEGELPQIPDWIYTGSTSGTQFGHGGTAGDVNGDGFDDLIVGASLFDGGETDEGAAFLFYGSPEGLSEDYVWSYESDQADAHLGANISVTAGDVNNDGYDDVIVPARHYDNGETDEGRVYAFFGSESGLSDNPDWFFESNNAEANFGGNIAPAGDVNNDGYDDIIIGASGYTNDLNKEGRAYVFYGNEEGLSTSPNWITEGNQEDARYGAHVKSAGDVNGDGFNDVIVGSGYYDHEGNNDGGAFLYYGSEDGLSSEPDWIAYGSLSDEYFGQNVSTAGDVNRDGYDDIIVGSYYYRGNNTLHVFLGSETGPSESSNWNYAIRDGSWGVGWVGSVGDVNADGYDDVIAGSPWYDNSDGRAWIFLGGPTGLEADPAWTSTSGVYGSHYGWPALSAGDVNGDGASDIYVGAHAYSSYNRYGRGYVYHGFITPFLDLPIEIEDGYHPSEILFDKDEGGLINAWFDHKYPKNDVDDLVITTPDRSMILTDKTTIIINDKTFDYYTAPSGIQYWYDGHNGYDFIAKSNTNKRIRSTDNGIVEYAKSGTYGKQVVLYHNNGFFTLYGHLKKIDVNETQLVMKGDSIGVMGNTGFSTGTHLHFGVYLDNGDEKWNENDERPVDPNGYWADDDPWYPSTWLWKFERSAQPPTCQGSEGCTITDLSENYAFEIPAGKYDGDVYFELICETEIASPFESLKNIGYAIWVKIQQVMEDSKSQPVNYVADDIQVSTSNPITITVKYSDTAILHLDEADIGIFLRDEELDVWEPLTSTVDTTTNNITALSEDIGHFNLQAPLLCPSDEYIHDDYYYGAIMPPTDGSSVSRVFDIQQDEDWFWINTNQGWQYTIETNNLASEVDTILEIYDIDGVTPLEIDNDTGEGLSSMLIWKAPTSGTYFIRVSQNPGSEFGCSASYDIKVLEEALLYLPIIFR